ncbi:hypothetical protein EJ08DRAFT_663029 [Tothia fuscella]|uniref:Uncharacterized protein n=1 Tax=Tothia fuscella TaxID=1048955 RepID=A0A9P4NLK0_9PEZI|nr:hypothetical protein EJ08DRAFT_663029 [Tothia fuscella]
MAPSTVSPLKALRKKHNQDASRRNRWAVHNALVARDEERNSKIASGRVTKRVVAPTPSRSATYAFGSNPTPTPRRNGQSTTAANVTKRVEQFESKTARQAQKGDEVDSDGKEVVMSIETNTNSTPANSTRHGTQSSTTTTTPPATPTSLTTTQSTTSTPTPTHSNKTRSSSAGSLIVVARPTVKKHTPPPPPNNSPASPAPAPAPVAPGDRRYPRRGLATVVLPARKQDYSDYESDDEDDKPKTADWMLHFYDDDEEEEEDDSWAISAMPPRRAS